MVNNIRVLIVDPHMVSRQSIDSDAAVVENYITHVMDLAFKDNKLIIWVYNKRLNIATYASILRISSDLCN
jgi:hypothetical protein